MPDDTAVLVRLDALDQSISSVRELLEQTIAAGDKQVVSQVRSVDDRVQTLRDELAAVRERHREDVDANRSKLDEQGRRLGQLNDWRQRSTGFIAGMAALSSAMSVGGVAGLLKAFGAF